MTRAEPQLRTQELTSLAELQALREPWLALWQRVPDATPFQHPDWLLAYCEPFHVNQPWCLALWQADRLAGLVPLVVYPRADERVVTLLGAGISDYQGELLAPEAAPAGLPPVLAWLATAHQAWDILEFEEVLAEAPLVRWCAFCGLPLQIEPQDVCPVLALPESVEQLASVISPHLAANLRYARRRAERDSGLTFEAATVENFDALFDALVRLHTACWQARGRSGLLLPPLEQFHRRVARAFLEQGLLRLYGMRVGGHMAAVCYGFAAHGRAYCCLGGWDPAYERLSPGSLVLAHAIEQAILAGDHEMDLLRGPESYKYAWGARDRQTFRLRLAPSAARAYAG